MTLLESVSELMALKSKHNITNSCYNDFVKLMDKVLPNNHKLPKNLYYATKLLAGLGLKYEKIDVCPNNYMLFWKEDASLSCCKHCKESRYIEVVNEEGQWMTTKVAAKQLRYMPIKPWLKWLFLDKEIARHMRWHMEGIRKF